MKKLVITENIIKVPNTFSSFFGNFKTNVTIKGAAKVKCISHATYQD